jgi:hypothetical protein
VVGFEWNKEEIYLGIEAIAAIGLRFCTEMQVT